MLKSVSFDYHPQAELQSLTPFLSFLPLGPPEYRGTLLVLEEFCIVLGIVIAYWLTFGTRYMTGEWSWRLPFLLQMIPGFILTAGVLILPFSPRWLANLRQTRAPRVHGHPGRGPFPPGNEC